VAAGGSVVYTLGLSTNPYGRVSLQGFGIARGVRRGMLHTVEVKSRRYGGFAGASWLSADRVLVPRSDGRWVIFRYDHGRLSSPAVAPVPPFSAAFAWSPTRTMVATEPAATCGRKTPLRLCRRPSRNVYVAAGDGSNRRFLTHGDLAGWTPDEKLVVQDPRGTPFRLVNPRTGRNVRVFGRGLSGQPTWSADGRYFAAVVAGLKDSRTKVGRIVFARAGGKVLRTLSSPYGISMLAWSPHGHRLAYTTNGFPAPHEVWVLDSPRARARKIFSRTSHFDWISWNPSGRFLLLDFETQGHWMLLPAFGHGRPRELPRLGGRPLWCCPPEHFSGS
jgi:hypothetical protein